MADWKEWLDGLKGTLTASARAEVKMLVEDMKADAEDFIRDEGEKLALYLGWLAEGKVTKEQFYGLLMDRKEILQGAARLKAAEAKKRSREFAKRIAFESFGAILAVL